MFLGLGANASTMVHYNAAGAPVSVSHGWRAPISMNRAQYAYNTGYRPRSYYRNYGYGYDRRPVNYRNVAGIYPVQKVVQQQSISRFNKNYSISPRRSYVANGVRYYN